MIYWISNNIFLIYQIHVIFYIISINFSLVNYNLGKLSVIRAAALMAIAFQPAGYISPSVGDTISYWNGCHAI